MKAVLGIGTNIGDRQENIDNSLDAFSLVPGVEVLRVSDVYETEPWGFKEQQNFYNIVCEIETSLSPEALLGVCLGIEAGMGRVRQFENGPRVIDLDVLVYEEEKRNTKELILPHPRIEERAFVLVPLKDLYPDMDVLGISYKNFWENFEFCDECNKVEKS